MKARTCLDSQLEELEAIARKSDLKTAQEATRVTSVAEALEIIDALPKEPHELLRRVLEKMGGAAKASRLEAVFLNHGYSHVVLTKAIHKLGLYRFYYDESGPSYLALDSRHGGRKAQ